MNCFRQSTDSLGTRGAHLSYKNYIFFHTCRIWTLSSAGYHESDIILHATHSKSLTIIKRKNLTHWNDYMIADNFLDPITE